jgi:hypothetical protein
VVSLIKLLTQGGVLYKKKKFGSIDVIAEVHEKQIFHARDPEWPIAGKQLCCS